MIDKDITESRDFILGKVAGMRLILVWIILMVGFVGVQAYFFKDYAYKSEVKKICLELIRENQSQNKTTNNCRNNAKK